MGKQKTKKPRARYAPSHKKQLSSQKLRTAKAAHRPFSWRFSECDKGGPWAWTDLLENLSAHNSVMRKLAELEQLNWNQLKRQRSNHVFPCSDLSQKARRRLIEIGRDDVDDLVSFHLTGKERIWCIYQDDIMHVLWWDPEHTVYPVSKRHT